MNILSTIATTTTIIIIIDVRHEYLNDKTNQTKKTTLSTLYVLTEKVECREIYDENYERSK